MRSFLNNKVLRGYCDKYYCCHYYYHDGDKYRYPFLSELSLSKLQNQANLDKIFRYHVFSRLTLLVSRSSSDLLHYPDPEPEKACTLRKSCVSVSHGHGGGINKTGQLLNSVS